MTVEKLKDEMNDALTIPGVSNSFTMPIKARLDMLATGIRTPVGIKVLGPNLDEIERIGLADRAAPEGYPRHEERLRGAGDYGLFPRHQREAGGGGTLRAFRRGRPGGDRVGHRRHEPDDHHRGQGALPGERPLCPGAAGRHRSVEEGAGARCAMAGSPQAAPAAGMGGAADSQSASANPQSPRVPLAQLADIKVVRGPTSIKSEEGLLAAYVYVDFSGRDVGGYVDEAKKSVASLKIPEGYRLEWSGEYEYLVKTHERLKLVIPLTFLIIFVLIYFNTKSVTKTIIVLLAVPFSLVGSFWLLYLLGYNMSIAVWVGIIALAGSRCGDGSGHAPLPGACPC